MRQRRNPLWKILKNRCFFVLTAGMLLCCALFLGVGPAARAQGALPFSEAQETFQEIVQEREIMAVVYLCGEYALKEEPVQGAPQAGNVPCGQTVELRGARMDDAGCLWLQVGARMKESELAGWMEREYLACSDERFLAWEKAFLAPEQMLTALYQNPGDDANSGGVLTGEGGQAPEVYADIQQFPESYRERLTALKKEHPNWIFVPMNTGLDWKTSITAELQGGKSLVHSSLPDCTKEGEYDQGNWYYASREVLERYMDPRNSLTEKTIFQFEQLTYNESYHTQEALRAFLNQTFMNNTQLAPGTSMTYDLIIWSVGKADWINVSPFHLAARIYQEQGRGDSPLISGKYPGYEGYYNYFNIGASGTTRQQVIENGLKYARNKNWNSAYYSILGGAEFLAGNYIKRGQDTLYLQKYNVNPNSVSAIYTHQYMQNISAPTTEALKIRDLYDSAKALASPFVFKIPVFENMPEEPCEMPASSNNIVLKIPSGYTGTTVTVDGVQREAEKRNGRLILAMENADAREAVIRVTDAQGKTAVYLWDLTHEKPYYTAAPWERVLTGNHVLLTPPEGFDDTVIWLDGEAYLAEKQNGKLIVQAPDAQRKTAVIYRYDRSGVPTDLYVWTLQNGKDGYEAKPQPELRNLLEYEGFSIRITGKTGIRFMSSIAEQTREKLLSEGVDGYRLTEYGTLVLPENYLTKYPLIRKGAQVACGVSYKREQDGTVKDVLYETVGGRHRFTGVLVDLTADFYRTKFAFRGYAVLEKDGEELIVYGPPRANSIYQLADKLIGMEYYQKDSQEDLFLRQLLYDADHLGQ